MITIFDKADLLAAAAVVGAGATFTTQAVARVFSVKLTGAGAKATVDIEASVDGVDFVQLARYEMTAPGVDGFASNAVWRYVRARVVAISGGGVIKATVGV